MLLAPVRVETFAKAHAAALARLGAAYGHEWSTQMVGTWFGRDSPHPSRWTPDRAAWAQSLPPMCESLYAAGDGGASLARLLGAAVWASLSESIAVDLRTSEPSRRERGLTQAGPAVAAVLAGAATTKDGDLRDRVLAFLREDERLTATQMSALRAGAKLATNVRVASRLEAIAEHCVARLSERIARPERPEDDWSIELPDGCSCQLCATLGAFLNASDRQSFEWPLAEQKRRHVHSRIQACELPVGHKTRRKGSPYTLVLSKTTALFERERDQRRQDTTDLAWLKRTYRVPT